VQSKIQNPKSRLALMLVAGEASGDKHGAHLMTALRRLRPDVDFEFFGAGGDEMRAAGAETLVDSRDVAIMGVLEVAAALQKFLSAFKTLREAVRKRKPDAVVLIDWPEFNLRLARKIRQDAASSGAKVIYYISPQVWAWRSYRVRQIQRDVDKMLVILPFEKEWYAQRNVQVEYVGHPLLDSVHVTDSLKEFRARYVFDQASPLIALLPGSRRKELSYILPPLVETARRLHTQRPEIQFVLPLAGSLSRTEADRIIARAGGAQNLRLIENDTYNALAASDLAIVASGTATLETTIIGTPLIVVYKASPLNWHLFTPFINVPFVGMPNLIAGGEIAPELLQYHLTPDKLTNCLLSFIDHPQRLRRARTDLAAVRKKLGEANASERAAQQVLAILAQQGDLHI
jgi:lipid-A-disaccharide synthase